MSFDFSPHQEYREYGLPWFGAFPAHWNVKRLGAVVRERGETNHLGQVTNVLSVMKDVGVIPYADKGNVGNKASEDITRYKVVRENDIVVNCMNVIIGSVGRSRYIGCLSPVYYVLTPRSEEYDPQYLELIFRHKGFQQSLVRIGNGILAHRMRIPMELLKAELVPVPPLEEQQKIVSFIQQQDRRIRKFIRNKKRLIELLREQFLYECEKLVKQGRHSDSDLVETSCEYARLIPANWKLVKLKRIAKFNPSKSEGMPLDENTKVVFLPMEKISVYGDIDNSELTEYHKVKNGYTYFAKNDVVVAKITPCFENGKGAFLNNLATAIGFGTTELIVMRPGTLITGSFLRALTNMQSFLTEAAGYMQGSAGQKRITDDFIKNRLVALPPLEEQLEINQLLMKKREIFEKTYTKANDEIKLIQEYRSRLIADAVTGKIDLRNFQPTDEEETPDTEPDLSLEDSDEINEDYSEDEELLAEAVNAN